jgi:hypothetical protein
MFVRHGCAEAEQSNGQRTKARRTLARDENGFNFRATQHVVDPPLLAPRPEAQVILCCVAY